MARDGKRQPGDDDVRERVARHVDPLPERIGAENHAVDVGLEQLDHLGARHSVALGIKGDLS